MKSLLEIMGLFKRSFGKGTFQAKGLASLAFCSDRSNRKSFYSTPLKHRAPYHMDDDIKKEQEIRPFLKLNDGFRKLVITGDDVPCHVNSMGITVMNVIDFMKNPFSLERI